MAAMAYARARVWAAYATRLSVFTVQVMCVVHLVNQHLFEVRMVGVRSNAVQRRLDAAYLVA